MFNRRDFEMNALANASSDPSEKVKLILVFSLNTAVFFPILIIRTKTSRTKLFCMNKKSTTRRKRITKGILLAVLGILLLAFLILSLFANRWIEQELNAQIKQQSKGKYSLTFSDLSVKIISRSIQLEDLVIIKNHPEKSQEVFKTKSIAAKRINVYQLLRKRILHIHKLVIDAPVWSASADELLQSPSGNPFAFMRQLQPIFDKQLTAISIDQIDLQHAGFVAQQIGKKQTPQTPKLNFNVGIANFYTDSKCLNRHKNFFNADDIYLRIDDFQHELADSLHLLSVHEIQYSLKNQDILGKQITLKPQANSEINKTRYFVDIPEITIKSRRLREMLQSDSIHIDSLFLKDAAIRVIPQADAPEFNFRKIKAYDLYELIEGDIGQLQIDYLGMNAQNLKIERNDEQKKSLQEFFDLDIELHDFLMNSNSYNDLERVLYAKNVFLHIGNYYLLMNDQIHRFDATNITASSENNFISADHLKLKPSQNPATRQTAVDLDCDSIRLQEVDLKRLFHNREMPLQAIQAFAPNLTIDQGDLKRKKKLETNSLLYHFIRNYIKGVYANVVEFNEGKVVVTAGKPGEQAGRIASDFSFRLTDFSLDSISAERTDKLFFATNIDLVFSNYDMKLVDEIHRLKVDELTVSSYNNRASIKHLHLFPDAPRKNARLLKKYHRSQIYDIEIPQLVLSNTNIHQAFFRKQLTINNFSIIEPKIYFEVFSRPEKRNKSSNPREFYELLSNYIEHISIGKITAPNGHLEMVTHSRKGKTTSFNNTFSVELENFVLNDEELDKKRLLFADDFELQIDNQLFQLSDDVHYLQASNMKISSKESAIAIHNSILYPDITSKIKGELPTYFHVNIPEIKLQGVNLEEAYFDKRLTVDHFSIQEPTINLYRTKGQQKPLNLQKIAVPLPKGMQRLSINHFHLNDGQFKLYNTRKMQETEVLSSLITMEGQNNSLVSQGLKQPATFKSDNISTTLSQLEVNPEQSTVIFTADQVHFSSQTKDLSIDNLLLFNTSQASEQSFRQLRIPRLSFNESVLQKFINNKCLKFESIQVEKPTLTLQANPDDSNKVNLYQLKIPIALSPLISKIEANKISVNQGQFQTIQPQQTEVISNIDLELNQFAIDTSSSDRLLGAQSVDLRLKNYAFSDKNNWYNFHLGDIQFKNHKNQLTISNITVTPRYSKTQFQKIIPFQSDHYRATIDQLRIDQLDLKRWYSSNEFTASEIEVAGGSLDIYRDKRTADNPQKRTKLPQTIVKQFAFPVYFDTVRLSNYQITYEEQTSDLPNPGLVHFSKLNLRAYPVTNLPYLLPSMPKLTMKGDGLLMDQAYLKTTMVYDMQSADEQFHVSGQLSPFQLDLLNPVVENTAGISVRSGQLNRFEFEFDANQLSSSGKLRFAYDDLRISILEHKNGDIKKNKLASFLANSLVLKSKHPRTRILLPSEIHFERDPQKSVINYWWKSVFSGAKNTFGIKEKEE